MERPGREIPKDPIAEGRIALIFPWGEGRILKLARDWVPDHYLENEFRIASLVFAAGMDTPRPFELIDIDGRKGIVYARVNGPTMLDRLGTAPHKAWGYGSLLGRLHAAIHRIAGPPDLPDNLDRLHRKIEAVEGAPDNLQRLALTALATLPAGNALLHGDFHPGNVLLTEAGPVTIDWPDATRGHPLADVARTVVLANMGGLPTQPVLRFFVSLLRSTFERAYLRAYFKNSPFDRDELQGWLLPVLFARLEENIESEREHTKTWLAKLAKGQP